MASMEPGKKKNHRVVVAMWFIRRADVSDKEKSEDVKRKGEQNTTGAS